MNKNVAQKAAKWWADQLRGSAKLDNGDESVAGAMTSILSAMLQETEKQKQDPELVDKFEVELTNVIMEQEHIWTISVDYQSRRFIARRGEQGWAFAWNVYIALENYDVD